MQTVDVFGNSHQYHSRTIAGMDYLIDAKSNVEIAVSTAKGELAPFSGDAIELHLPKDALVVDLGKRAKLYAKIQYVKPTFKDKTKLRRLIKQMMLAHLVSLGKVKEVPKTVAVVQFPNKHIQVNISPFVSVYADA